MTASILRRKSMDKEEYYWARYEICDFNMIDKKSDLNVFSADNRKKLKAIYHEDMSNTVVLFPGFENYLYYNTHHEKSFVYPPLLNIAKDPNSVFMDMMQNDLHKRDRIVKKPVYNTNLYPYLLNKAGHVVKKFKHWDDRYLFRFYAINEFCILGGDLKLGEFIESNMDELYTNFRNGIGTESKYSYKLIYDSFNNFLQFMDEEPYTKYVLELTKNEIHSALEKRNSYYPMVSIFADVSENLAKVIFTDIKSGQTTSLYHDYLMKAFSMVRESIKHHGIILDEEEDYILELLITDTRKTTKSSIGIEVSQKIRVLKALEPFVKTIEPDKLISFILSITQPTNVFDDNEVDYMSNLALLSGFEGDNLSVESFIEFIAEIGLNYSGALPSHEDLIDFINDGGTFSNLIPASMLVPILSKNTEIKNNAFLRDNDFIHILRLKMTEILELSA